MSAAKRLAAVATVAFLLILGAVSFATGASAYPPGTSPKLTLAHSSGAVGDHVIVTWAHFAPNYDVSLEFNSTAVNLGTAHADSTGSFSVTITVPVVARGAHSIIGSDAFPESAAAVFTVTGAGGGTGGGNSGVAVIGLGAIGGVLFTGGTLMLLAGRRRKVIA